ARGRVVQARGDAGAEQGHQRHRLVGDHVVGGQQADRRGLEHRVEVAALGQGDHGRAHAGPPAPTARYTVRPHGATTSAAWLKLSEWPVYSRPSPPSRGAIFCSTRYWVGLSKHVITLR